MIGDDDEDAAAAAEEGIIATGIGIVIAIGIVIHGVYFNCRLISVVASSSSVLLLSTIKSTEYKSIVDGVLTLSLFLTSMLFCSSSSLPNLMNENHSLSDSFGELNPPMPQFMID